MRQLWTAVLVALTAATVVAAPKFLSVWKSPDVARLNFAGKKVAALVITDDQPLQMLAKKRWSASSTTAASAVWRRIASCLAKSSRTPNARRSSSRARRSKAS